MVGCLACLQLDKHSRLALTGFVSYAGATGKYMHGSVCVYVQGLRRTNCLHKCANKRVVVALLEHVIVTYMYSSTPHDKSRSISYLKWGMPCCICQHSVLYVAPRWELMYRARFTTCWLLTTCLGYSPSSCELNSIAF